MDGDTQRSLGFCCYRRPPTQPNEMNRGYQHTLSTQLFSFNPFKYTNESSTGSKLCTGTLENHRTALETNRTNRSIPKKRSISPKRRVYRGKSRGEGGIDTAMPGADLPNPEGLALCVLVGSPQTSWGATRHAPLLSKSRITPYSLGYTPRGEFTSYAARVGHTVFRMNESRQ